MLKGWNGYGNWAERTHPTESMAGSALLGHSLVQQHHHNKVNQGVVPDENSGNSKKGG
jgi:hypothetical protein